MALPALALGLIGRGLLFGLKRPIMTSAIALAGDHFVFKGEGRRAFGRGATEVAAGTAEDLRDGATAMVDDAIGDQLDKIAGPDSAFGRLGSFFKGGNWIPVLGGTLALALTMNKSTRGLGIMAAAALAFFVYHKVQLQNDFTTVAENSDVNQTLERVVKLNESPVDVQTENHTFSSDVDNSGHDLDEQSLDLDQ